MAPPGAPTSSLGMAPGHRPMRSNSYTSAADNLSTTTGGLENHYNDDMLAREVSLSLHSSCPPPPPNPNLNLDLLQTEAALSIALEASRSEASALRIAYAYANEKHTELKSLYDQLVAQLQEDGSMLTKRDKERYKSALKDLRDYEIYKQVMEAAMVRMQAELEAYAKENQELKHAKASEERSVSKFRATVDKLNKDVGMLTKRLGDVEPRLANEEKKSKQLARERDAAVAALAQSQGQLGQKVAQMTETLALRQKEMEDMHKRLKHFEERCKGLEGEKEALLVAHNTVSCED